MVRKFMEKCSKTIDEIFIDGTVPTKKDDTKVGIDVDAATGDLWADGCTGPMQTRGFLDHGRKRER